MWFKLLKQLDRIKKLIYYHFIYKFFKLPYYKGMMKKCGNNIYIGKNCELFFSNIELGDNVFIGDNCSFIASISTIHIGNHVAF